jgi:hypothetical protein
MHRLLYDKWEKWISMVEGLYLDGERDEERIWERGDALCVEGKSFLFFVTDFIKIFRYEEVEGTIFC